MTFADDAGEYTIFARNPLERFLLQPCCLMKVSFLGGFIINGNMLVQMLIVFFCILQEAYELYMKKQQETFKTEVTTIIEEPKVLTYLLLLRL